MVSYTDRPSTAAADRTAPHPGSWGERAADVGARPVRHTRPRSATLPVSQDNRRVPTDVRAATRPVAQPLRARWDPVDEASSPGAPRRPGPPGSTRKTKRRSAFGWFLHRYGWRAYALPVLTALTTMTVIYATQNPPTTAAATRPEPHVTVVNGVTQTLVETVVSKVTETVAVTSSAPAAPNPATTFGELAAGMLPPGGAFAERGAGTWHVVPGAGAVVGAGTKKYTYRIQVEDGVGNADADAAFARVVDAVLSDQRSWLGDGTFSFQRIDSDAADFSVSLTSQMTTRKVCGFSIPMEASCYYSPTKQVIINDARWQRGAVAFNGDLGLYRVYAINHEVGHVLGFRHEPCRDNGALAPVMMQQSWAVANNDLAPLDPSIPANGLVCRPNPYPFPTAAPAR